MAAFAHKCTVLLLAAGLSALPLAAPAPSAAPLAFRVLPAENIIQYPELPNGCEGTSLAIALNYYGFEAEKTDVAMNVIPREDFSYEEGLRYGCDPGAAYPGDPRTQQGFYCYAAPVAEGANGYLGQNGSALRARDSTGITEEELVRSLSEGHPVIVWVTYDGAAPWRVSGFSWITGPGGETLVPYGNIHVAVLRGYDAETFYMLDPQGLTESMERARFMQIFERAGSRAVTFAFGE